MKQKIEYYEICAELNYFIEDETPFDKDDKLMGKFSGYYHYKRTLKSYPFAICSPNVHANSASLRLYKQLLEHDLFQILSAQYKELINKQHLWILTNHHYISQQHYQELLFKDIKESNN